MTEQDPKMISLFDEFLNKYGDCLGIMLDIMKEGRQDHWDIVAGHIEELRNNTHRMLDLAKELYLRGVNTSKL